MRTCEYAPAYLIHVLCLVRMYITSSQVWVAQLAQLAQKGLIVGGMFFLEHKPDTRALKLQGILWLDK